MMPMCLWLWTENRFINTLFLFFTTLCNNSVEIKMYLKAALAVKDRMWELFHRAPLISGLYQMHFYSSNLQSLIMFTLNDIYYIHLLQFKELDAFYVMNTDVKSVYIFIPYNSDYLLTMTSYIPSWKIMNDWMVDWFDTVLRHISYNSGM